QPNPFLFYSFLLCRAILFPFHYLINMTMVHQKLALRGNRHLFSASDDNVMVKQILATHAPDDRNFDVTPLLHIVEDIFHRATPADSPVNIIQGIQAQTDALDDIVHQSEFPDMLEYLSQIIYKISCEISCKCSGGKDAHATTVGIFNILSSYSWDAKVVIALAAFAVNFGEFRLVAQLYSTNSLAKGVALLKQLPEMLERVDTLKPKYEAISNLIKAMLDVTKCIIEFKELPSQYIAPDTPEMLTATTHIPTAVYWTIRSVVACASQVSGVIGMTHEYITSTTEAWELSSLAHKVNNIHSHLKKQLALCYKHIDEKRQNEAFQRLVDLFNTPQIDNEKILKALIYNKDDQLPLFEGSTKRRVSIDVLRRKNVLLFITGLDLAQEELMILDQMYQESRQDPTRAESEYEVVWLPVVDRTIPWNEVKQNKFDNMQLMMPWYSVFHPSVLEPTGIRYIKEVWHFNYKPTLVVLDLQGKVVNPNAIHMMWIWGSLAYPFTSSREEALWRDETWRIELLADTIDPMIFTWITEGKYICLYGGEDMEWIRKFTAATRAVAQALQIPLEMLYVGKSNPGEKVLKINTAIVAEGLSHVLPHLTLIWFFWVRLESMWHSKLQHGKTVENDPIMKEIMTMLSFDGSDQGWACD
ncbi:Protein SIEVE ELEMENT OCCLUSION B like, partial [Quillaja saponaria]